jgi:LPXTG-site transpeptidase (sortase) family protein
MSTGRRRASTGLAATGAALVAAGLVAWVWHSPAGSSDAGPGSTDTRPTNAATVAAGAAPEPVLVARSPGAPRLVSIPALGVAAPVVPVTAPNGTLVPPADAEQLGWWADGARPGAARGSALVAGHTVHTGGGALHDLEQLTRGERVVVRTDSARLVYEVARVRVYSKGRLARDAERVFSQEAPSRLVLITCEDWDGRQYLSNVVVVARPVDV